jgi:hypothetical protein
MDNDTYHDVETDGKPHRTRVFWTNRVRAAFQVKGAARAVLYALADRANDAGLAWPGQTQLALDAGVTDRTVRDALGVLEAFGYIENAGTRHGADVWRMTIDVDGSAIRDRKRAPERKGAPAERGSCRTGKGLRKDRKRAPDGPERGSDKESIEEVKEESKEEVSEKRQAGGNAAPKARRHRTGTHTMPSDGSNAASVNAKREQLVALAKSLDSDAVTHEDEANLARLVIAHGDHADLIVRWLYSASKGTGWDRAEYHAARGIKLTVFDHGDRLLSWARAWDKAGRPSRLTGVSSERAGLSPWDDMAPRLRETSRGARVLPHNPTGIMLADDDTEHERRRQAWGKIGGVASWGRSTSDYERADIKRRWIAAYGGMR